jgi:hypothetical protein
LVSFRATLAQSSSPELANVTEAAFAVFVPFFAPNPSTLMTSPVLTLSRPQPSRSKSLIPTSSIAQFWTLPLSFLASMKSHACGFVYSIFVTVPVNLTGRLTSNSAANEWCDAAGAAASNHATPPKPRNQNLMSGPPANPDRLSIVAGFGDRLR